MGFRIFSLYQNSLYGFGQPEKQGDATAKNAALGIRTRNHKAKQKLVIIVLIIVLIILVIVVTISAIMVGR